LDVEGARRYDLFVMFASNQPESFEQLLAVPESALDVTLGAALIARDVYPMVDPHETVRELRALGTQLSGQLQGKPPKEQAERLCVFVHDELGFTGNDTNYYDPKNSLLPDVLSRRTGIPITLALVYLEVARTAGAFARGVGFPGHFLVRIDEPDSSLENGALIDPFAGTIAGPDRLRALLARAGGVRLSNELLMPTSPRAMLFRMLSNLKAVFTQRGDFARAHVALTRILALCPSSPDALQERAELALRLGAVEAARADFESVRKLAPRSREARVAATRLQELGRTVTSSLN
jgi:regulator of sirC expression with transglutaminase-like and TPR domain